MTRTKAHALALVNWKGVFYERYELDPRVTALEGANGAGKTTVMIAAYVVLLPDMSRLRFTNVGEHGAAGGDKGLFGRLGHPDAPSYAALDLQLADGERLIAGVKLDRHGESTVEPTPFLITGLRDDVKLQDLLLVHELDADRVPEVSDLRNNAAVQGGQLHVFASAKDYFAALFDKGVNPLRLALDEERTKLNEMLRTSMLGGMSKVLTGGLRDFLLKEESGLADTLKHMRASIDACHRTRLEVEDAQRAESEISEVLQAGQTMFNAAVHASRERAAELESKAAEARRLAEEAETERDRLAERVATLKTAWDACVVSLEQARREEHEARAFADRTKQAHELAKRIEQDEENVGRARHEAEVAATQARHAAEEYERAERAQAEAHKKLEDAMHALADQKQAIAELESRAEQHRRVCERLEQARRLLDEPVAPDHLDEHLRRCADRIDELNRERLRIENELADLAQRRQDFARIREALESLVGHPVEPERVAEIARETLTELRRKDLAAQMLGRLREQLDEARTKAKRQSLAREAAAHLSTPEHTISRSEDVSAANARNDESLEQTRKRLSQLDSDLRELDRTESGLKEQIRHLTALAARWRELYELAQSVSHRRQHALSNEQELRDLLDALQGESNAQQARRSDLKATLRRTDEEIEALERNGGRFDDALLKARDHVGGELLAGRFEEVDVAHAGEIQALLGPLASAIVVDDPERAARELVDSGHAPDNLWLVGGEAELTLDDSGRPAGRILDTHALVRGSQGWRLTRMPERPTIGRKAREHRLAVLREERASLHRDITALDEQLASLDQDIKALRRIERESELFSQPDPKHALAEKQNELSRLARTREEHSAELKHLNESATHATERRKALLALLPQAELLDAPDQQAHADALHQDVQQAQAAHEELTRIAPSRRIVEESSEAQRRPPPGDDEVAALRTQQHEATVERDRLSEAREALREVAENRHALAWTTAQAALDAARASAPEQLRIVEKLVEERKALVETCKQQLESARSKRVDADSATAQAQGRLTSATETLQAHRNDLATLAIDDATDEGLRLATERADTASERARQIARDERELQTNHATASGALQPAAAAATDKRARATETEAESQPAQDEWKHFEQAASEAGVLAPALAEGVRESLSEGDSQALASQARESRSLLIERLKKARDGAELLEQVSFGKGAEAKRETSEKWLQAWLAARDWVHRRVPAQIADLADPLEALKRLQSNLVQLRERLERQEEDLRGRSTGVARNIHNNIARATRQVNLLNKDLDKVAFGSVRGVQIRLERDKNLEKVLEALETGTAQEILFKPGMPLDVALDELFQRHTGGRIQGQRLLDYREYVQLRVEVRRASGGAWEPANPTRLSTGEGIGVGAALMMVVLTAWERDANLLRGKKDHGTLRFLFLDEATRLSQDSLAILFDLCESLELQLLIAAPEVAHAGGNTTYRLVRQVDEVGHEHVVVTGRRVRVTAA